MGVPAPGENTVPLIGTQTQQTLVMNLMIIITVVCVPLMLCVKPCVIANAHKNDVIVDANEFEDDDAF
jgi:hypothetical protein